MQIAHGLRHIHDLDVVHRHLEFVRMLSLQEFTSRPHNISGNDRGGPRWRSSDFGFLAIWRSPFPTVHKEYTTFVHL